MSTAELLRQNGMEMGVSPVIGPDPSGPTAPSARTRVSTSVSQMSPEMQATLAPLFNGPDKIDLGRATLVGNTLSEGSPAGMRVQPPSPRGGGAAELLGGITNVAREGLDRMRGQDPDGEKVRLAPANNPALRIGFRPHPPMAMGA